MRRDVALKLGADTVIDPSDGGAADRICDLTASSARMAQRCIKITLTSAG